MASAPGNNKELFIKLAEGDEAAFRSLFDAYRLPFFSAAFKLTRSSDLAEEIVQEIFVALWEKRKMVGAAKNPLGYFVTMLHNRIYSHLRSIITERNVLEKIKDHHSSEEENPVEELLLAKEHRELLQRVIGQLPPQQQLVYRLAKQEGLSREEIAEKLGISVNTVRNHLAAAVEFIRTYFKKGASAIILATIWSQL